MNYEVLTLDDADKWEEYLSQLNKDQQDVYYCPDYYRLFERYGDGKAMCFVFKQNGELALYPFMKNSINELGYCLPDNYYDIQGAYGYNGVISSSKSVEFIDSFYNAFTSFCLEENIVAEFTRFNTLIENSKFSSNNMQIFEDRETIKIELNNYLTFDQYLRNISKEVRKKFNSAIRNGLEYKIANSLHDYEIFNNIYTLNMEYIKAEKYYYFNLDFMKNIFINLRDKHKLFLVRYNDKYIGGFIIFHYGTNGNNFLSAGLPEYRYLNVNDFMQIVAIKIAFEFKCKLLNLGGGNSSLKDDTLLAFKRKFSSETSKFYIGKKIYISSVYNEIVKQWEDKFPERKALFGNRILKYRF